MRRLCLDCCLTASRKKLGSHSSKEARAFSPLQRQRGRVASELKVTERALLRLDCRAGGCH